MYKKLAEQTVIGELYQRTPIRYSRAVEMTEANAVQVEWSLINNTVMVSGVTVQVQESNDLENWTDVPNGSGTLTDTGYQTFSAPNISGGERIGSAFTRLKYIIETDPPGSGGVAILSAGINTLNA